MVLLGSGIGLAAGVIASGVMDVYQTYAAPAFKLPDSDEEPSTVMTATRLPPWAQGTRKAARGSRTRSSLCDRGGAGIIYGVVVSAWPAATFGFGLGLGVAVWVGLDLGGVPSFGWGNKPWENPSNVLVYALSAHLVFGVATESVRRGLGSVFG